MRRPPIIARADCAREAGEWQLAAGLYRAALERAPNRPPIWIQYGHALKESGSPADAENAYRTAIAYQPADAEAHLHLGHVLKLQGRRVEAEVAYRRAWALDRSSLDAQRELDALSLTESNVVEAAALAVASPKRETAPVSNGGAHHVVAPRRKETIITRADRARDAQQWPRAARLYRKALDRNPKKPLIWVQYGHALKESGDPIEAERAYRTAISYAPGAADAHLQLGHALKLQGKTKEAQAAYLRAFALDQSLSDPSCELSALGWGADVMAELEKLLIGKARAGLAEPSVANSAAIIASEMSLTGDEPQGENHPQPLRAKISSTAVDRVENDIQILRESGLFDEEYYRTNNLDLPSGIDLLRHFVEWGAHECRDPHPLFMTSYYLKCQVDVANSFKNHQINPAIHFLLYGVFENRKPHPLFDTDFYSKKYYDIIKHGINPLVDYLRYGVREQRICNAVGHSPFDNYGLLKGETPELAGVLESFPKNPTISIVMPLYAKTSLDKRVLIEATHSIQGQTYSNWELCICNDGSTQLSAIRALDDLRKGDPRIRVTAFEMNQGISAATNAALDMAGGDFVALMDHDDLLAPNALYEIVKHINRHPSVDVLYTDQDKVDIDNNRSNPFYKPDWSPEMFRGVMYVGHLMVVRRSLLNQIGGLDSAFDKVQDFELMLRLGEATERIIHIPKILYHWRMIPGSLPSGRTRNPA